VAPDPEDVARLVRAIFALSNGLQRARRNIPDAAALAVLQVLGAVERDEPGRGARPSEIADFLDVHRSAVTHHLQTLTKSGFVQTVADPKDRRSSIIRLTDAGRDETARLAAHGMARFASFVADWPDDEVRELSRLLEKFMESQAATNVRTPPPSAPDWKSPGHTA
jgi:DNA-binding MarR family transcriptional regulator